MDDHLVHDKIERLVAEEHELLERGGGAGGLRPPEHARLEQIRIALDRSYDLLRQRRARREFGLDPEDASTREAGTVERYEDTPDPKLDRAD